MTESPTKYRHVVLFKFKDSAAPEKIAEIEHSFIDLCAKLPFVSGFEWGNNSSTENLNNGFTHCFIVTFAHSEDRDLYLPHPSHQAFCKKYLDPNLEKVCVVDFSPEKM